MSEFVRPLPPDDDGEDVKTRPKSRKWFWISTWLLLFFVLPAVLVGFLHREQQRRHAASRETVGERSSPVAPVWVPVRSSFRIEHAGPGTATLHSEESIAKLVLFYEHKLRENGFQVSSNLMERDQSIFAAILNASDASERVVLVTLRSEGEGTRIELTFRDISKPGV